ncbi:MAG: hypothetical protein SF182_21170, partial [Deltaproteobacteria bacterium]|nr:hypothetical protein [Deltaproteobacteria bacterium]
LVGARDALRAVARDPAAALRRGWRDERAWMAAVILVSAAARLVLCLVNRESNDDHTVVAHMIRSGGWLPPASSACMECSHAKLFHYVLAAAFEWIVPTGDASRMLGNLLNFAAGTALLVLCAVYLRRLPISSTVRLLALAFVSFNPAVVGIFSQTTNDGFVILFSSLAIFAIARVLDGGRLRDGLGATLWAILAAASKASGWVTFAAGTAVLVIASLAAGARRRRYAAAAAVFVAGFLLVVPLLHPYRQNLAQAGTPFVNDAFYTPFMAAEVPRPPRWPLDMFLTFRLAELLRVPYDDYQGGPYPLHRESLWSQLYGRTVFLRFDQGIWRNLDPRLLDLGRVSLVLGLLPLAALLLGCAGALAGAARGLSRRGLPALAERTDWQHLVYVGALLASLVALLIRYHRLEWLFTWMKAIYLFPALLSLLALFALGLQRLWRRWPRLVALWMALVVLVSIVDLTWLIHDLAWPSPG